MKGYIDREFVVWCGVCAGWERTSQNMPAQHFTRAGWKKVPEWGWICPKCVEKGYDS